MDKKKLLIIDGHGALRYILGFDLEKKGFAVISAGTGQKGIELSAHEKPDLVIMEEVLPDGDGPTIRRKIQAPVDGSITPVIMLLSEKTQQRQEMEKAQSEKFRCIAKPLHIQVLFDAIASMIGDP